MSAVVSVMITRITTVIEMIAPIWNRGVPNENTCGSSKIAPFPTAPKSALPISAANRVPTTMPIRMDSRDRVPWTSRLTSNTTNRLNPASPMLDIDPQSGALALPPIAQRTATGRREMPMTVMIDPVTTGGK